MTASEFARPERLDSIGAGERSISVSADPAERAALARRFGIVAVEALHGDFTLRREAAGIRARGQVTATVIQACSVTGEPLTARIDEPVDLLFVDPADAAGDEVELTDDTIDTVFHDGAAVDLGEAAAETMALALDPFPRSPEAGAALRGAGVLNEAEAGPFGRLAALLKKDPG